MRIDLKRADHWYYKNNRYTRKYKCHVLYKLMCVLLNMFVKNHCLSDSFVNIQSIYPFLPPVVMYIVEF